MDSPRKLYLEDARKFSIILTKANEEFIGFVEAINTSIECHYAHRVVHSYIIETAGN